MKKIILLFFLFLTSFSNAQTWCPPGATWHYGYATWDPWLGGDVGYLKYEYVSDTIINGIEVKKIDKYVKTHYADSFYTYADSNKVYIYHNNTFFTLYDFSAQPGDTLTVPGKMDSWYSSWCTDSLGKIIVDSIGTTIINGESLRYLYVSPTATTQWGYNAKIIEKIGPVSNDISPFEPTIVSVINCSVVCPTPDQRSFRCYSDNSFGNYNFSSVTCDFSVSINENISFLNFQLSPNPTSNILNIEFEQNSSENTLIEIKNIVGQTLYSETFKTNAGKQIKTLDISMLQNGVYFIQLKNKNNIYASKFIKQ